METIDTRKLNANDYLVTKEQVARFIKDRPSLSANEFAKIMNGDQSIIKDLKEFINETTFETVIKGE
jgi:hypothetical protein